MTPEAFVHAQNVSRTYTRGKSDVLALVSATCSVQPGDRIAVVGPSGSGKSTLLHILGGLDRPTSGEVSWLGLGACETLRPEKIGFVFQSQSLLPSLNVVENVELPLQLMGADRKYSHKTALEVLDRIKLADLAEKLPGELSGGQMQRVAIARVLATQPKLILADEPTGQLDQPTAQCLFDFLLATLEGLDTALVIATHDLAIARRMNTTWRIQHGILEVNVS